MNPIVQISEDGTLHLPTEILELIKPNTRFVLEVSNQTLILHPENKPQPLWATATPEERAEHFLEWARSHKGGPNLPDEAMHRDSMYD
jgi:hypothetical protein